MGLFSWLKTSEKAVDTGLDLVKDAASGVDMLWFTDEEKAQQGIKIMEQALEFNSKIRDENSVRAKTRRRLATLIITNYLLAVDFGIIWLVFKNAKQGETVLTLATGAFGTIVLCVVVSYYGYYGVMNVLGKGKK